MADFGNLEVSPMASNFDILAEIKIDDERVFLAYRDRSDSFKVKCQTFEVRNNYVGNGQAFTLDASSQYSGNTPILQAIDACMIDTDKVVVIYVDGGDNQIYSKILNLDSLEISGGSAQQINSTNNAETGFQTISVCKVDTNKFACLYTLLNVVTGNTRMRAATVSGTVATYGTEDAISTSAKYSNLKIAKMATDKVVYTYIKSPGTRFCRCRTLSGTTFGAEGTELTLYTGAGSNKASFYEFSDNVVYLASQAGDTTNGIHFAILTASGTTLTEADSQYLAGGGSMQTYGLWVPDSTTAFVFYRLTDSSGILVAQVNISSTTITSFNFAGELATQSPDHLEASVVGLGDNALFFYLDDASGTNINLLTVLPIYAVEEKRNIAANALVSWKKDFRTDIRLFAIGVSSIGGNDIIAPTEQIDSQWNKYLYYDESQYLKYLEYEHGLQLPIGGIRVGLAEGEFENTTGRFTPRYMGGTSELFTAILPRRPFILNAGFEDRGVEISYPQFVGLFSRQPEVSLRNRYLRWVGKDFVDFLSNRFVDDEAIYTGYRSDQLIEQILDSLGFTTGQYELDRGLNTIPFAIFKRGDKFGDIIDTIAKAEYANFYQDEEGILRFENRQHWDESPHNEVQWEFVTSQVLEAELPNDDHIINVVEVKADVRQKQPAQTIFTLNAFDSIQVNGNSTEEVFVDFSDPVLAITTPTNGGTLSFYKGNTAADGSGSDATSSLTITKQYLFSNAAKFTFSNSSASTVYITELVVNGRPAKVEKSIYYRTQDDSSVTAYEERPYLIENDFIQSEDWASTLSQLLLIDFASPEKLQTVTIRAIPQLRLGDLVSWQGKMWRVFEKSSIINASTGFVQEVKLLQRTIQTFFRIGISTIGGTDKIAP